MQNTSIVIENAGSKFCNNQLVVHLWAGDKKILVNGTERLNRVWWFHPRELSRKIFLKALQSRIFIFINKYGLYHSSIIRISEEFVPTKPTLSETTPPAGNKGSVCVTVDIQDKQRECTLISPGSVWRGDV